MIRRPPRSTLFPYTTLAGKLASRKGDFHLKRLTRMENSWDWRVPSPRRESKGLTNPAIFPAGAMRAFRLLSLALVLAGVFGCNRQSEFTDIPAQSYTSRLNLLGKGGGSLTGRLVFPSEYTQRSAVFFVDGVKFTTQPDGRFHVTSVPVGAHELRVQMQGFEPVTAPVAVADKQEASVGVLKLRMARGVVIGRLVDPQGRSASGVSVSLKPHGGSTYSDQDGIFQFMGVGPGDLTLAVADPYFAQRGMQFRLGQDERRNLAISPVPIISAPRSISRV